MRRVFIRFRTVLYNNRHSIICAIIPIIGIMVLCIRCNFNLFSIYLPASERNDEIMYYKQVEAVLRYGIPQGFFGYNEKRALYYSFATWGPAILVPWIIWGKIFGWNIYSPYICNTTILVISMACFGHLVKPSKMMIIKFIIIYILFTPISCYALSAMPEIFFFSLVLIYIGLALNYCLTHNYRKIWFQVVVVCILSLIRPYYILLILFPTYSLFADRRIKEATITILVSSLSVIGYLLISKMLCAPYYSASINMDWINVFTQDGFRTGIVFLFSLSKINVIKTYTYAIQFLYWGMNYLILFLLSLVYILTIIKWARRENAIYKGLYLQYLICAIGIWIAMWLLYVYEPGSRHITQIVFMGIVLLVFTFDRMEKHFAICVFLSLVMFVLPHYIKGENVLPSKNIQMEKEIMELNSQMKSSMVMSDKVGFDSTIIYIDDSPGGSRWNYLYALPAGYGINFCTKGYVEENYDELESRYLFINRDNVLNKYFQDKLSIAKSENIIVYDLFPD